MQTAREVEFAKRLSVSDKSSRDKALKKLRTWLHSRSLPSEEFCADEMMKLWRGLHYCMWMSDKPLIQEDCAKNISSLVHSLATSVSALRFVDCGWLTLCQEWHTIDRLRLDKYLMMMRHYLRQNFAYLQKHKWETELVDEMLTNFTLGILDPNSEDVPLGVQLHLTDIYVPVLQDLAEKEEIPWKVLERLLRPVLSLAAETAKPVMLKATCQGIIEPLLELTSVYGLSTPPVFAAEGEGSDDDEAMDTETDAQSPSALKVDHAALAQIVFSLASVKSVSQKNRSALYLLKRRFESIAVAHVASESSPSTDTVDDSHVYTAERDVSATTGSNASASESSGSEPSSPVVPSKKRKRKRRAASAGSGLSVPSTPVPAVASVAAAASTPTHNATEDGSPQKKKRIRLSLKDNQVKQFSKKDPIDVSPWKPSSKEGKSLLKNKTPTPITPRMRRILAQEKEKSNARRRSTGDLPSAKSLS